MGAGLLGLVGRYALPAKFDVIKGKDARDFDAGFLTFGGAYAVLAYIAQAGAAVIGLTAFISIQWFKVGIMTVIAAAGIFGFIWHQLIL